LDIHKPKPWHGWPEFLKEIGTIVIGVLIALGAEQAVEWLHWRNEVASERSALLDEARANLSAVNYRIEEDACITRRLAEVEEGFRRQGKGRLTGFKKPVSKPPMWVATTGTWDIALSGQALAHMTHKEKLRFSDAFDAYRHFGDLRNEEDGIWRRLGLLNHPDILTPADGPDLHQAFNQAAEMNNRMKTLTKYIMDSATLGGRPEKPYGSDRTELQAFCTSLF
jgi:hypothetical protein